MDNPLKKHEEVLFGGQMTIVIGFVATFLLGVVFVFLLGNLLGQISDGLQAVSLELSGNKRVVIASTSEGCLNGLVRGENADIIDAEGKTSDMKIEEVINRYSDAALNKLALQVYDCTYNSVATTLQKNIGTATVAKTGTFSIESAVTQAVAE